MKTKNQQNDIFSDLLLISISIFLLLFILLFILSPDKEKNKEKIENKKSEEIIDQISSIENELKIKKETLHNWKEKVKDTKNKYLKYSDLIEKEYSIYKSSQKEIITFNVFRENDKYFIGDTEFNLQEIEYIEKSITKGNGFEVKIVDKKYSNKQQAKLFSKNAIKNQLKQ